MKKNPRTPRLTLLLLGCCYLAPGYPVVAGAADAPADSSGNVAPQTGEDAQQSGAKKQDVLDRLFSPLDRAVDDINRDTNRDLDRALDHDKTGKTPPTDESRGGRTDASDLPSSSLGDTP